MIKIKERIISDANDIPIAVLLDYEEYKRLKEIEEEAEDYKDAIKSRDEAKEINKWHTFDEVINSSGLK
jgi:hypothetical protein